MNANVVGYWRNPEFYSIMIAGCNNCHAIAEFLNIPTQVVYNIFYDCKGVIDEKYTANVVFQNSNDAKQALEKLMPYIIAKKLTHF